MEARSQTAAHPDEMNFILNLNTFSWKAVQRTAHCPAWIFQTHERRS
jgi:hypothetical protein